MKPLSRILLVLTLLLTATALMPGTALSVSSAETPESEPPDAAYKLYMPLTFGMRTIYTVSGQLLDANKKPLTGATLIDSSGRTVTTDASGKYTMSVPAGSHALAPAMDGYHFSPSIMDLNVSGNVSNQNFTGTSACTEAVVNDGFEDNAWWDFPASEWRAGYSTDLAHGGLRSARTGILNQVDNRYAYSSVRSSLITIPADTANATLRLWLYPISTEAINAPVPASPNGPDFGDTSMAYDAQYVLVLDANDQLIQTLSWMRSNNQQWTYHEFNLSRWAGRTIKFQAGSYNDGTGGVTSMYVDDASLELCPPDTVPTPPPQPPPTASCTNYLVNSGFEYNTGWNIPYTKYPATYSTDYSYTGVRSMRTGIPLWSTHNRYSYSDAWQTVSVPANAASVTLHMKMLALSEEDAIKGPIQQPKIGSVWGKEPLGNDAQYVMILDPYTQRIREFLIWWQVKSKGEWIARDIDLTRYAGQSIRIQFGTYNDGWGGRTAMYVDDTSLDVCTSAPPTPTVQPPTATPTAQPPTPTVGPPPPTPTATTGPPPPVCTELVYNNSFEYLGYWEIPITAFSAGYSTLLANTGSYSMRTGILYQAHNRYSYSDFRQTVFIPYNTRTATLNFSVYPTSGDVYTPVPARPTSAEFGKDSMSGDVQYLLILDRWGNWIDTLLWRRSNSQTWTNYTYDLSWYSGDTIKLQWGTYNNGWGGVTSMFVDDVSLQACP